MKPRTSEAFVLRTWPLGESDLLVSLFTREEGKVRGVARGARRSRRRFGGALEPLTLVLARFVEKEGRDLVRIEDLEVRRSHFEAQGEPAVAAAFGYVAEIVDQFGHEKAADESFFRLVGTVTEALSEGVDPRLAARYFETWTLRFQGLLPDFHSCPACGQPFRGGACYDRFQGELCCRQCSPGVGVGLGIDGSALTLAGRILAEPLSSVAGECPDPESVAALARLQVAVLDRFLERPIRSLRLLEEMTR